MDQVFLDHLAHELDNLRETGLYKAERVITSPQQAAIRVQGGDEVINFCANNYLGLANHPQVIEAARQSYGRWGYGLSSVRFICGTQTIHKALEACISNFLGCQDTILYSSCFDANTGLFFVYNETEGIGGFVPSFAGRSVILKYSYLFDVLD